MAAHTLTGRDSNPEPLNPAPIERPLVAETKEIQEFVHNITDPKTQAQVSKELQTIVEILAGEADRDNRKTKFDAHVRGKGLSKHAKELFDLIERREATHIHFMYVIWPQIYKREYGKEIPLGWPFHDHSKDAMFMFVMAAKFDLKLRHEAMDRLFTEELKRHYFHEPHHPEFERERKRACEAPDILEMAVDRMARNMQNAGGKVDKPHEGRMNKAKFLPHFYIGDEAEIGRKETVYWDFVEKYREDMENHWSRIYGEQFQARPVKRKSDAVSQSQGASQK